VSDRFSQAELLSALWVLGGDAKPLDLRGGAIDRALHALRDVLPSALRRGELSFSVTAVGLRCFEIPDILMAAQEALLIDVVAPGFVTAEVRIDEDEARLIACGHGLSTDAARDIGRRLREESERTRIPQTA
jgi:hypothetical protein